MQNIQQPYEQLKNYGSMVLQKFFIKENEVIRYNMCYVCMYVMYVYVCTYTNAFILKLHLKRGKIPYKY